MYRLQLCLAVCGLLCLTLVGCGDSGPALGTVTGTVTMDGQPLEGVLVTFSPVAGGRASTGTTDAAGKYELIYAARKGAEVGEHKVSVTTIATVTETVDMSQVRSDDPRYEELLAASQAAYDNAETSEPIPAKYNTSTELVKEVTSGSNTIDLELTSS